MADPDGRVHACMERLKMSKMHYRINKNIVDGKEAT